MKLESQVPSLDLCKRLKELGVKQESYFWWVKKTFANDPPVDPWIILDCIDTHALENIATFTVAELGELLPPMDLYIKGPDHWALAKNIDEEECHFEEGKTEADARAKMLIYLIENNLLTLGPRED